MDFEFFIAPNFPSAPSGLPQAAGNEKFKVTAQPVSTATGRERGFHQDSTDGGSFATARGTDSAPL